MTCHVQLHKVLVLYIFRSVNWNVFRHGNLKTFTDHIMLWNEQTLYHKWCHYQSATSCCGNYIVSSFFHLTLCVFWFFHRKETIVTVMWCPRKEREVLSQLRRFCELNMRHLLSATKSFLCLTVFKHVWLFFIMIFSTISFVSHI